MNEPVSSNNCRQGYPPQESATTQGMANFTLSERSAIRRLLRRKGVPQIDVHLIAMPFT